MGNKKISKYLFYLFILLLPWQTRLILLPAGVEYLSLSIYLSEIVLWLAIGFWLVQDYKKIRLPGIFLIFLIFAGLSVLWAENKVAGYRLWLYVFEGMLVFVYLQNHQKYLKSAIKMFLASLIFVSCFAIFQFFNLGSEAFKWLGLAERGAWNLGDIVVLADAGRWLRAYGSMPHPNILAGYLAVGILSLLYLIKKNIIKHPLNYIFGALFIFTLFLTFSRSAWLSLVIAGAYFLFKNLDNRAVRKFAMFSLILIAVLGYIFSPFITTRVKAEGRLEDKSNVERLASWKSGVWISKENFLKGTGVGNYIVELNNQLKTIKYTNPNKINLFQPTHNIFLLVLAELGIFGFLLYFFIWRKFWKIKSVRTILLLFLVIGLFDHYLWSLYSGQMLFWLGLGLISQEN